MCHITSRGNAGQDIFWDDEGRLNSLKALEDVVTRYTWICHASCLMPNHYHLLVETPAANLSPGMQLLNGAYPPGFNRRNNRLGHVLRGGGRGYTLKEIAEALGLQYATVSRRRERREAGPSYCEICLCAIVSG